MQGRLLVGVGCALAAVLFTAGCGGAPRNDAGQVTASASADAFQVKVGDCTGELGSGTIENLALIPCDQTHYWEAYSSTQLTDATYPGNSAVSEQANKLCSDTFEPWSGIAAGDTKYDITFFYPTLQTWTNANDREILCFVGTEKGGLKGSLKGAKK
jgi:hypothetical protein